MSILNSLKQLARRSCWPFADLVENYAVVAGNSLRYNFLWLCHGAR